MKPFAIEFVLTNVAVIRAVQESGANIQTAPCPDQRRFRIVVEIGSVTVFWQDSNSLGEPVWVSLDVLRPMIGGCTIDSEWIIGFALKAARWTAANVARAPNNSFVYDLGTL